MFHVSFLQKPGRSSAVGIPSATSKNLWETEMFQPEPSRHTCHACAYENFLASHCFLHEYGGKLKNFKLEASSAALESDPA